jgi:molybdopterin/thiamine biosynthesis adenylyltransferase
MKKMAASNVLVVGVHGLGVEIGNHTRPGTGES